MRKTFVYIDESGTLPDPKDKVIVVAAVVTASPYQIDAILQKVKKKTKHFRKSGELKFYTAGDKTKLFFFEKLKEAKLDIFVLVIDKMGRKIADAPQNYALLCWLLLSDVITFYPVGEIILDRHFFRESDSQEFNDSITELFNIEFNIRHVESVHNKRVNLADMVAGAVLAKETGKTDKFFLLIEKRIVAYKKLNWVEAKRRLFPK